MLARYYITDRHALGGIEPLLANLERLLSEGITMVQLREKDLSPRQQLSLARRVRALPNPHGTRILINDRLDVALAAGLDGVHLRGDAPAVLALRQIAPPGFLFGVSCHSLEDVRQAHSADFVVLGPIFASFSKPGYGPLLGVEGLKAASAIRPVYALGGITAENTPTCAQAGAFGIAAITMFQPYALAIPAPE